MKKLALAALLTISLAGCASIPRPAFIHRHHKPVTRAASVPAVPPPVIVASPAPPAPASAPPPTFTERFRAGLNGAKWVH